MLTVSGGVQARSISFPMRRSWSRSKNMTERARVRSAADAATEAVKTYIGLHRKELARDGELLALLLPERFSNRQVGDIQRHVIEKLRDENARLRSERDGLKGT